MIIRRSETQAFEWEGLSIADFTAGRGTDSSLAVIDVPAGAVHPRAYSTRSEKYYYVAAGSVEFTHGPDVHVLERGDVAIVPTGERFAYRNIGDAPATLVLVHTPGFDPEAEHFDEDGGG